MIGFSVSNTIGKQTTTTTAATEATSPEPNPTTQKDDAFNVVMIHTHKYCSTPDFPCAYFVLNLVELVGVVRVVPLAPLVGAVAVLVEIVVAVSHDQLASPPPVCIMNKS